MKEALLRVSTTPVTYAENVSRALGREVWVKRDDQTHADYGGNKPRKLVHLLAHAREIGAEVLVPMGTVGSHYVLATAIHGRAAGFEVRAVLMPQPRTEHAEATVRATLSHGAMVRCAQSMIAVPFVVAGVLVRAWWQGKRAYLMPVGGSDARGTQGYVEAVRELAEQVCEGEMPAWPELIFCAHGSGSTHAGLVAGVLAYEAPTRVLGVQVVDGWMASKRRCAAMARGALRAMAPNNRVKISADDVVLVTSEAGRGYGHPTEAGAAATELFARDGIVLDPTYTAKTAAALIAHARGKNAVDRYLFWHTLSSVGGRASAESERVPLPEGVRRLLR